MKTRFYNTLVAVSQRTGLWFFVLVSGFIATGYFLTARERVAASVRFYRALYPDRKRWYAHWRTWRQFQQFTTVFMDRIQLASPEGIRYSFEGWDHLARVLDQGKGAVLLMSHIGNWEMAAHLLGRQRPDMRLLLYMGIKEKDAIERLQKDALLNGGIRVVAVDRDAGSPFDLVEGMRFIRGGGVVSMSGDMVWHSAQRTVSVNVLGHEAQLPEVPYMFALLTGAPVFAFFANRRGAGRYHFSIAPPMHISAENRSMRSAAITRAAQTYADLMVAAVRRSPSEWFHFYPFLGRRSARRRGAASCKSAFTK